MLFWKLQCHACGKRSQYSKGTPHFQCSACQAPNFFDENGDYADPPASYVDPRANSTRAAQPLERKQSRQGIFCQECVRNQQIYHELLSNYLPDDDDPSYNTFARKLPQYKGELEQRYPQICKKCAPKAQAMIHDADYFTMTNNAGRLINHARGGRRRAASPGAVPSRDNGFKMVARVGLDTVGWILVFSALYQVCWHAFAILQLEQDFGRLARPESADSMDVRFDDVYKTSQCLEETSRLRFSYPCFRLIGTQIPSLIAVSALLVWYNQGLKKLYHPTIRIASVAGWQQHLVISVFTLAARPLAYLWLNDIFNSTLLSSHRIAAHAVSIILIVAGHLLARSSIATEKWRVTGSIMPRPEDKDILGQYAGPAASERHTPRASNTSPAQLLTREATEHFPIANLAPRRSARNTPKSTYPPSPPGSDGDPMDIEPIAPADLPNGSPTHARSTGWNAVRTNLFSIEDENRARVERGRQALTFSQPQQSLFRSRLPAAPMSQERQLRNPVSQVPQFKEVPITQRQDFLQQMKQGIERGRGFVREPSIESDATEVSTSAMSRTRGQLDLAQSEWHLPSDVNAKTGLEDIFGGSFSIEERSYTAPPPVPSRTAPQVYYTIAALFAVLGLMFTLDIAGLRRSVCLYFVKVLEENGY